MNPDDLKARTQKVTIIASCLVMQDGKYLMVEEQLPDVGAVWHPPSGTVERGEDIEAAAVRRTKEQTGYEVKTIKNIGLYHELAAQSIKHVYSAEVTGGEVSPQQTGVLQVAWLSYAEIEMLNNKNKLRAPWVWNVIQKTSSRTVSQSGPLKYL